MSGNHQSLSPAAAATTAAAAVCVVVVHIHLFLSCLRGTVILHPSLNADDFAIPLSNYSEPFKSFEDW